MALNTKKIMRLLQTAASMYQSNDLPGAKIIYQKLIKQMPANLEVINNLGIVYARLDDFQAAHQLFNKSLLIAKNQPSVYLNFSNLLLENHDFEGAAKICDEYLKIESASSMAHFNKGRALSNSEKNEEAIAYYKKTLEIDPNFSLAYLNMGFTLNKIGKYEEAIKAYDNAIKLDPNFTVALYNRGIAQYNSFLFEDAIKSYKAGLEVDSNFILIYPNLGRALERIGKNDDALVIYNQGGKISPNHIAIFINRGNLYASLEMYEKSEADYNRVVEIDPNDTSSLYAKALLNFKFEKFNDAWPLYDLRWNQNPYIDSAKPELVSLKDADGFENILIWSEQGIGDQLFFLSMVKNLNSFFKKILISVDSRLVETLKRSFDDIKSIKIIPSNNSVDEQEYDCHIPICSLGRFFINRQSDIKKCFVPFMRSDSDKLKQLKKELGINNKKICGISWKSTNKESGAYRSLSLQELIPILQLEGFTFVNLQYGDCRNEINTLKKNHGLTIINISSIDNFNNLNDFTSLIDACDLVISIDNSTVHFAGTLNKKTYLLRPYANGSFWYWGTNQIQSSWYSSVKIFKQEKWGEWHRPISLLIKELNNMT